VYDELVVVKNKASLFDVLRNGLTVFLELADIEFLDFA